MSLSIVKSREIMYFLNMKRILIFSLIMNLVLLALVVTIVKDKKAVEDTFIAKIISCDPTYFDQEK